MKKAVLLILILCLNFILISCTVDNSDAQNANVDYEYLGEKEVTIEDRTFKLEDLPESIKEEIVALNFMYTITGNYDGLYDITADTEIDRISIDNVEKNYLEGVYIQSYVIHNISTLTELEYDQQKFDSGEVNPLYYYGWESVIEKYGLSDYEIINVEFTQLYPEKALAWGPQLGNGRYSRNFIVAKTDKDKNYKIYDFGMM